jgi:hypothetical protein
MIFASVSYTNFKLALLLRALHAAEQSARVSCVRSRSVFSVVPRSSPRRSLRRRRR